MTSLIAEIQKSNRWVIGKKPKRLTINGKSVLGTLENY